MIFLIEYDRQAGTIIKIEEFNSAERESASQARLSLEIELFEKKILREVVLLEADSLDALQKTHNRYFRNVSDLTKTLKANVKLNEHKEGP